MFGSLVSVCAHSATRKALSCWQGQLFGNSAPTGRQQRALIATGQSFWNADGCLSFIGSSPCFAASACFCVVSGRFRTFCRGVEDFPCYGLERLEGPFLNGWR